jgi:predicted cupin superfamily sugar epimerase
VGGVLLLTTLETWRSEPAKPFRSETAAYSPEEDAVALANEEFGPEPLVALVVEVPRMPLPGAINRETVREVRYARRDPRGVVTAFDPRSPVADALDLLPHPEGGWFRETWRTATPVAAHGGERATATGIYFLLAPGEESVWHSVRSDELWLWHRGGPLSLTVRDETGGAENTIVLGPEVEYGQTPQSLVPAGAWQSARPRTDREVLVSCIVSPGFDPADFTV